MARCVHQSWNKCNVLPASCLFINKKKKKKKKKKGFHSFFFSSLGSSEAWSGNRSVIDHFPSNERSAALPINRHKTVIFKLFDTYLVLTSIIISITLHFLGTVQ